MSHVRQQCRDAIITALQATATAGSNVLKSTPLAYDIARISLPALGVSESNETRTPQTLSPPRLMEVASDFLVTIYAEDSTDCESVIDAIAVEVEAALAMPIAGPWKELTLIASGIELQDAQKVRGRRALRYRATYTIRENAPDSAS